MKDDERLIDSIKNVKTKSVLCVASKIMRMGWTLCLLLVTFVLAANGFDMLLHHNYINHPDFYMVMFGLILCVCELKMDIVRPFFLGFFK